MRIHIIIIITLIIIQTHCAASQNRQLLIFKNNNLNLKILLNASTKYTQQVYETPNHSNYHYNFKF